MAIFLFWDSLPPPPPSIFLQVRSKEIWGKEGGEEKRRRQSLNRGCRKEGKTPFTVVFSFRFYTGEEEEEITAKISASSSSSSSPSSQGGSKQAESVSKSSPLFCFSFLLPPSLPSLVEFCSEQSDNGGEGGTGRRGGIQMRSRQGRGRRNPRHQKVWLPGIRNTATVRGRGFRRR